MATCHVLSLSPLLPGAREAAFRNIKSISECLADELINAAKVNSCPEWYLPARVIGLVYNNNTLTCYVFF